MANAQKGKELEVAERRAEVGRLTRKRWSSRRIAEHLGVSHTTVSRDVDILLTELAANAIKDADKIRADELETLADTEAKVIEILDRVRATESGTDKDGNEDGLDLDITLRAADRIVKVQERRAKLLGLDAAIEVKVQQEMSREVGALLDVLKGKLSADAFDEVVTALGGGSEESEERSGGESEG